MVNSLKVSLNQKVKAEGCEFQFSLPVGNKTDSDGFLKDGSFAVWFLTPLKIAARKNVRPYRNQSTTHHRRLLLHRERANTDHSPWDATADASLHTDVLGPGPGRKVGERGNPGFVYGFANEGLLPCLPFFAGLRVNRLVTSRALWSPAEIFHLWTMLAAPALPTRTAPSRSSTPTRRPPRRASWRSTPGGPPPRPSWPRRTPSSSTRRLL